MIPHNVQTRKSGELVWNNKKLRKAIVKFFISKVNGFEIWVQ